VVQGRKDLLGRDATLVCPHSTVCTLGWLPWDVQERRIHIHHLRCLSQPPSAGSAAARAAATTIANADTPVVSKDMAQSACRSPLRQSRGHHCRHCLSRHRRRHAADNVAAELTSASSASPQRTGQAMDSSADPTSLAMPPSTASSPTPLLPPVRPRRASRRASLLLSSSDSSDSSCTDGLPVPGLPENFDPDDPIEDPDAVLRGRPWFGGLIDGASAAAAETEPASTRNCSGGRGGGGSSGGASGGARKIFITCRPPFEPTEVSAALAEHAAAALINADSGPPAQAAGTTDAAPCPGDALPAPAPMVAVTVESSPPGSEPCANFCWAERTRRRALPLVIEMPPVGETVARAVEPATRGHANASDFTVAAYEAIGEWQKAFQVGAQRH